MKGRLALVRKAKEGVRKVKDKMQEGIWKVMMIHEEVLRVNAETHKGTGENQGDSRQSPLVRAEIFSLYSDYK